MHELLQNSIKTNSFNSRFSLADIANILDVPVIVATYSDVSDIRNYSTFGLDFGVNWSEFTAAIDVFCADGAKILPNIEVNAKLGRLAGALVKRDICFFVGIPLCDFDGWRIGSIAVMANARAVARKGIEFRRLGELGREFAGLIAPHSNTSGHRHLTPSTQTNAN